MAGPASLWVFDGTWRLDRQISHLAGQGQAHLDGTATFRKSGQILIYDEVGMLTIEGQETSIRATRRYLWKPARDWINVSFEDGRPFHSFPLGQPDPEAVHLCTPDRYRVNYDFSHWPLWSSTWTVTGPDKDYTMLTRYERAA
jgi:hypothetical protein